MCPAFGNVELISNAVAINLCCVICIPLSVENFMNQYRVMINASVSIKSGQAAASRKIRYVANWIPL